MKNILITGGAGFIGTNAVDYFAKKGWNVYLLDNLSRKGSEQNQNGFNHKRTIRLYSRKLILETKKMLRNSLKIIILMH